MIFRDNNILLYSKIFLFWVIIFIVEFTYQFIIKFNQNIWYFIRYFIIQTYKLWNKIVSKLKYILSSIRPKHLSSLFHFFSTKRFKLNAGKQWNNKMDIKLIIFNIDKVCKIVRKNIQYFSSNYGIILKTVWYLCKQIRQIVHNCETVLNAVFICYYVCFFARIYFIVMRNKQILRLDC